MGDCSNLRKMSQPQSLRRDSNFKQRINKEIRSTTSVTNRGYLKKLLKINTKISHGNFDFHVHYFVS